MLKYVGTVECEILWQIAEVERIAVKTSIRDLARLRKMYGKALAQVEGHGAYPTSKWKDPDRRITLVWYEAHGIGKREIRWKRYLD